MILFAKHVIETLFYEAVHPTHESFARILWSISDALEHYVVLGLQ